MAHRTDNHSDLTLFKNRLWKLMDEKHIYTTKELAKMLYNQKLVTVRQKNSYDDPSKIYGNAIGAIDKKIQKHLNADTAKELQGEFVIAYCTFFGCSSDYLFGFIDCKTHDVQFIQNETGLSENAINKLLKLYNNAYSRLEIWNPESCLDIINNLLTSEDFMHLIQSISNADSCAIEVLRLNDILSDIIQKRPHENKTEIISDINFNVGELARFKFQIISMFHGMIKIRYKGIGELFEQCKNDFTIKKQ